MDRVGIEIERDVCIYIDLMFTLDDLLAAGPLILYFYPADFTAVCTAEACEIRDRHEDIARCEAQRLHWGTQGAPRTQQLPEQQHHVAVPFRRERSTESATDGQRGEPGTGGRREPEECARGRGGGLGKDG